MSTKNNPLARAINRNVKNPRGSGFDSNEALATLCALADRINANSGSPSFTADEHEALLQVIYRIRGEA